LFYLKFFFKFLRSQRSAEAIEAFIRRQLESPVQLFNSEEELASRIEVYIV